MTRRSLLLSVFAAFTAWRKQNQHLDWDAQMAAYRAKLKQDGLNPADLERTMNIVYAYDEAELYDKVYAGKPDFNTKPNQLLVEAIANRKPGKALDIAMGQGRNAVYLAQRGWDVTGFEVSAVGIAKARAQAKHLGLKLNAVRASDEEFDFGTNRWDLIANIYAMEKRSIHRARTALKAGGLLVVEAGHKSASSAPFEYDTGELRDICKDLRILRYEEPTAVPDFGKDPIRLVRLIAERPHSAL